MCLVISTWTCRKYVELYSVQKTVKRKQIFIKLFGYEVRKEFPKILQIEKKN